MNEELELRKEYIFQMFERYKRFEYMFPKNQISFCVRIKRKNSHDEIKEFLKNNGYEFFHFGKETERYENEQKIYLSLTNEGTQISFAIDRFETLDELKNIATILKEYLNQFLLDTKFFDERFLRGEAAGKNHVKVAELYEKVKPIESHMEEPNKRKVFNQLDTFGKFIKGMCEGKYYYSPYGYANFDVDVINEDEIVIEKIHLTNKGEYANKECKSVKTETETVEVFDGVYTRVFTEKSAKEIEKYFSVYMYKIGSVKYDFIKTKDNQRRLQGIYLKNVYSEYERGFLYISTDDRLAKREEISPYLKIELLNEIKYF